MLLLATAGVVSWGITQTLKGLLLWKSPDRGSAPWFNPVLRVFAIVAGAALGFWLTTTVVGAALGAAAGALNTTIVALVKSKVKAAVDSKTENSQE